MTYITSHPAMEDKTKEYFEALKEVCYPGGYDKTSAWVRNRFAREEKTATRFSIIYKYIFMKRMKVAYALLALVALVGACNYPVPYDENMGTVLTWQIDETQAGAAQAIS